jgi:hypothetical protein
MTKPEDEVIAHSAGIDEDDAAGCVIQFNSSALMPEDEVVAHSIASSDEDDAAGCVIQFNSNLKDEGEV